MECSSGMISGLQLIIMMMITIIINLICVSLLKIESYNVLHRKKQNKTSNQ